MIRTLVTSCRCLVSVGSRNESTMPADTTASAKLRRKISFTLHFENSPSSPSWKVNPLQYLNLGVRSDIKLTDKNGEQPLFDFHGIGFNLLILNQYGAPILKQRKLFFLNNLFIKYSRTREKGRDVDTGLIT